MFFSASTILLFNFNSRPSARGDAARCSQLYCDVLISIHAPPRGATKRRFGSRRRRHISIHAPPRGATKRRFGSRRRRHISIHAPPRGATRRRFSSLSSFIFQFTPLREGRRFILAAVALARYFNSRPSARGDMVGVQFWQIGDISIHAPPRGATGLDAKKRTDAIFQFTPLREGRQTVKEEVEPSLLISIHAPPRGAT